MCKEIPKDSEDSTYMDNCIKSLIIFTVILTSFICAHVYAIKNKSQSNVFGYVYFDHNKNGIFDFNEYGIFGVKVIFKGKEKQETKTNDKGYFEFNVSSTDIGEDEKLGILLIDKATLPTNSLLIKKETTVTSNGKFNIGIFYKRDIFDLYKSEKPPDYQITFLNENPELLVYGNLDQKTLFMNGQPIEIPEINLNLYTETIYKDENLVASFTPKYSKTNPLNLSDIVKRVLIIRNQEGEIIQKKTYPENMPNYILNFSNSPGTYFLQGAFGLSDGTIIFSEIKLFYVIDSKSFASSKTSADPNAPEYNNALNSTAQAYQLNPTRLIVVAYGIDSSPQKANSLQEINKLLTDVMGKSIDSNASQLQKINLMKAENSAKKVIIALSNKGIASENIKIKPDFKLKNNELEIRVLDIKSKPVKPFTPKVAISGETLKIGTHNRFYQMLKKNSTPSQKQESKLEQQNQDKDLDIDCSFPDGSRIMKKIPLKTKTATKASISHIQNETIDKNSMKIKEELIAANYSGTIEKGYKFFIDGDEIVPDLKGRFSVPMVFAEGDNIFAFEFEDKDEKKEVFSRVFNLKRNGNDFYLTVILSKDLKDFYDPPKEEFMRVLTNKDVKLKLNTKEILNNNGAASQLYIFKEGENQLNFDVESNNKKESKTLLININFGRKEDLFVDFGIGMAKITTTASGLANETRDYSGMYSLNTLTIGAKPFALMKNNYGSNHLANLGIEMNLSRGNIQYTGAAADGSEQTITARPTSYSLKILENYNAFDLLNGFKYFKNSSWLKDIDLVPVLEYEKYSFKIKEKMLFRNAKYSALVAGLRLKYRIPTWRSHLGLYFDYAPIFNYTETPDIGGLNILNKTYQKYGFYYAKSISRTWDLYFNLDVKTINVTYENGDTATDQFMAPIFGFKWYYQ